MVAWERLKNFVTENRTSLTREFRFVLVVFLWVSFYVFIMRNRWTQIEEMELSRNFTTAVSKSFEKFEEKFNFWDLQARNVASFVNEQTPAQVKQNSDSWATLFDSHPEWLATHVVTKRRGFEPGVALTLTSRQLRAQIPNDTNTPVSWLDEAQSSALQLTSSKTSELSLPIQPIRTIDKDVQWVQILFKVKKSPPGWSTWVVHTFSEKLLPDIQDNIDSHDAVLYFPQTKKFLVSRNFSTLKIENSELMSLLEQNKSKPTGFSEQSFAIAKKTFWLGWKYSKNLDSALLRILPNAKIPKTGGKESPSIFADWVLSLLWMVISAMALWWSYSNNLWRLRFVDRPESEELEAMEEQNLANGAHSSRHRRSHPPSKSALDRQYELSEHLLNAVGPSGKIILTGKAEAVVQVSPSPVYKGSWWMVQNIDENRILVIMGDVSGEGMTAGSAAYSARYMLETLLPHESASRETDGILNFIFEICGKAAEGAILGKTHIALFATVIELEQQKLCFLNAGYPSPILKIGEDKKFLLSSFVDPVGLGIESVPAPRWLNLPMKSELVLCNLGARNADLDEIADSELVKIFVHPFGAEHEASIIPIEDEMEAA